MLRDWLWLAQTPGIGAGKIAQLLSYFGTPEAVYFAGADALALAGMSQREITALSDKDLTTADTILEECDRKDIRITVLSDAAYPDDLRQIPDPPPVLYYYGRLPDLTKRPVLGVVGARSASAYGLTSAKRLGYQIGRCGGIVVTGLARGIDTQAAEGALTADTQVIGVLGCGVDVVYPPENRYLFRDVIRNGCILSEFPPGTPPYAPHFPQRNRIISGLSDGVIVVEAAEKSGSLITADLALEQGRDVFAVPGNIDNPACVGSNQLLRDGARLITCGWDAVQEYLHRYPDTITEFHGGSHTVAEPAAKVASPVELPAEEPSPAEPKPVPIDVEALQGSVSADEFAVLRALKAGEKHIDELIAETGLAASKALTALTLLEVKKHITRLPGKRYTLATK